MVHEVKPEAVNVWAGQITYLQRVGVHERWNTEIITVWASEVKYSEFLAESNTDVFCCRVQHICCRVPHKWHKWHISTIIRISPWCQIYNGAIGILSKTHSETERRLLGRAVGLGCLVRVCWSSDSQTSPVLSQSVEWRSKHARVTPCLIYFLANCTVFQLSHGNDMDAVSGASLRKHHRCLAWRKVRISKMPGA